MILVNDISPGCRLKKLRINGNQIESLPCELQGCQLLEELYASENSLHELPPEIGTLKVLRYSQHATIYVLNNAFAQ
jgi:Leucine-rich repeat (LRR) protein